MYVTSLTSLFIRKIQKEILRKTLFNFNLPYLLFKLGESSLYKVREKQDQVKPKTDVNFDLILSQFWDFGFGFGFGYKVY